MGLQAPPADGQQLNAWGMTPEQWELAVMGQIGKQQQPPPQQHGFGPQAGFGGNQGLRAIPKY